MVDEARILRGAAYRKLMGFARGLLREAKNRVETAQRALKQKEHAYCLRQSQEAVELALKAALRLKGVEYPKFHDVSDVLLMSVDRFPRWFSERIPHFAEISRKLTESREASMYGFEEVGQPPETLVSREAAEAAANSAREVFNACRRLSRR